MTKRVNQEEEPKIQENSSPWVDLGQYQELDGVSGAGYVCDLETGYCGPVENIDKNADEKIEKKED